MEFKTGIKSSNSETEAPDNLQIKPIGYIHTNFPDKFGIPRQSGIVDDAGYIELLEPYNDRNALRGLEEFSHLWLIWLASENLNSDGSWDWHSTARPPRLGGNERKGIFATRSPFHPNRIGLSCVKIVGIDGGAGGTASDRASGNRILISGADVVDGTPLLDIKPYIPYSDSHPDARSSYAQSPEIGLLEVVWPEACDESEAAEACGSLAAERTSKEDLSPEEIQIITQLIAQNPRPQYHTDEDRIYAMRYSCYEVKFSIKGGTATIRSLVRV